MVDIPTKFVSSLQTEYISVANRGKRWITKFIYEFWGFCINGGNSLTAPGGFASSSPLNLPSNFESGSTVLLVSGNDGYTHKGGNEFYVDSINYSVLNFTGNINDKYLVIWKSGSTSTDDSIYRIIGTTTASFKIEMNTGGTAKYGNAPGFTERDQINFRLIDMNSAVELAGWTDNVRMVLQFNAASDVNANQLNSQFFIGISSSTETMTVQASPSGTWNGTNFTDGSALISKSWVSGYGDWLLLSAIGGKDFLFVSARNVQNSMQFNLNPPGLHVEIPKRLYPASLDPNPIAWSIWRNTTVNQLTGTYASFYMIDYNGITREHITMIRSPFGDHTNTNVVAANAGVLQGITNNSKFNYGEMMMNSYGNKYMITDGLLHTNTSGTFSAARVRLRRVKFTVASYQQSQRFGKTWIYTSNGVLLPWQNVLLPLGQFQKGI